MTTSLLNRKPLSKILLIGVLLALGAVALLATSVNGYRSGGWFVAEAMQYAEWAVYVAGASLLFLLPGLYLTRPATGERGFIIGVQCLFVILPIIGMAAYYEYAARIHPPINDISTDLEDPPLFWDMPNPMDHPGETFAEEQLAGYADIAPLTLPLALEEAHALALEIVKERRWEIIADVADEGRIEAEVSSFLYGFKDEIVIRVQEDNEGTIIDMRSRSRVGRIDRGVNAKRIRAFLAVMKERSASLTK